MKLERWLLIWNGQGNAGVEYKSNTEDEYDQYILCECIEMSQ